ncbi:chalcone isomerase family protein [Piscinibacter sp.]|uniref:chalcone isomerase family protein n=1 Tax=Piscinibacter sp. TaxID=1903157 RepID=UPI00343DD33A
MKEPEFFSALLKIWLGHSPADAQLKEALLGKERPFATPSRTDRGRGIFRRGRNGSRWPRGLSLVSVVTVDGHISADFFSLRVICGPYSPNA